jgi:hypothetical protein
VDVRIDRLSLEVSGMSAGLAGRFGRQVAERLSALLATAPLASGPARSGAARLPSLHVSVPEAAGRSQDALAEATATAIARALRAQATR